MAAVDIINPQVAWVAPKRTYKLEPNKTGDTYEKKVYISTANTAVDKVVPRLRIELLEHQCYTVRAMMDIENKRLLSVNISTMNSSGIINPVVETCAAVLSEKPGSGKTEEILALIALQPSPPSIAEITSIPTIHSKDTTGYGYRNRESYVRAGYTTEVRRIYKRRFKQTLIFVGKSVMRQWTKAVKEFTDFKAFVINDIFDLRRFYDLVFGINREEGRRTLGTYDIILIKNGIVSGKFDIPELQKTDLKDVKSKPIISIFSELFKDTCFNRVVLDDFDNLGVPTNATVIPSLFTWFVSATKKAPPGRRTLQEYHTIKDIIRSYRPTYVNAWNNRELFTFFNLGCENSFIDKSVSATQVHFYTYTFVNPNETFIGALGAMGTQDAATLAEMANADALGTAAAKAGIKSNSVADIFEKILDNKWNVYKHNLSIARYIPRVRQVVLGLPILVDDEKAITATGLGNLRKNIKKPGPLGAISGIVKYRQTVVDETIQEAEENNNHDKEENGKAIQRVKDNLREGYCPIMSIPLSEAKNVVILKCCGVTLSWEAITMLQKECPNCRSSCDAKSMIVIDKELKLDDIVEEQGLTADEPIDVVDVEPEFKKPAAAKPKKEATDVDADPDLDEDELDLVVGTDENELEEDLQDDTSALNKFNCIVKIIKGRESELQSVCKKRAVHIPNMIVGTCDKGTAPAENRKILVFANFRETLVNLEKKLDKQKVRYLKLLGKPAQIDDIVRRYWLPNSDPESVAVLLVNGSKYCAGLNLQNTTDLIYTHKVIDKNIETQIAGRAARYGREFNLNVHYVLYQNEYVAMFNENPTVDSPETPAS